MSGPMRVIVWARGQTVKGATKAVLLALSTFADADGFCWPGVNTLATAAGCNRSTVQRSLRELERQGLISTTHALQGAIPSPAWRLLVAMLEARGVGRVPRDPGTAGSSSIYQLNVASGVLAAHNGPPGCETPGGGPHDAAAPPPREDARSPISDPPEEQPGGPRACARPPVVSIVRSDDRTDIKRDRSKRPVQPDARPFVGLARIAEVYVSTMKEALGRPWGLPSDEIAPLRRCVETYAGSSSDPEAWIASTLPSFVRAHTDDPIGFGGGWPRAFERWLANGRPIAKARPRSVQQQPPAGVDFDAIDDAIAAGITDGDELNRQAGMGR